MLETSTPSVASPEYISVFSVQCHSGAVVKTFTKLWNANGCGQSFDDSAWSFVINAVSVMKANGARNMIAAAMRMLWFATAASRRLRRTLAGGRRRTNAGDAVTGTAPIS